MNHHARAIAALSIAAAALAGAIPLRHACAQDLGIKAPAQTAPVAIVGATIHPISAEPFQGAIVFDKGVITQLVPGKLEPASGTTVIDGRGRHVYPGLIAPHTHLGLTEIGAIRPSTDTDETGSITPEVRAALAVNPDSWLLPVTRTNGVLIAATFPGGGLIPGRAGVIRLDGWTSEEMAITTDAGLVVEWPLMRVVRAAWMDRPEDEQLKDIRQSLERIRDTFKTAAAYSQSTPAKTDLRWEAMRAVFPQPATNGKASPQLPLFVQANDYDQIVAAIELKRQYKLSMVIIGGLDAPRCAALLKEENVPVILTNVISLPRRDDSAFDENFALPAKLAAAGVRFCIASGDETPHERNLPYAAARAAAYGLTPDQALRAVTLSAAEITGIAARYGSLESGKSATIIVTDGHPLEVGTVTSKAYIDGREIDLSNKQSALAAKYRERYRQQKQAEAEKK